jgi:hypothetical protein
VGEGRDGSVGGSAAQAGCRADACPQVSLQERTEADFNQLTTTTTTAVTAGVIFVVAARAVVAAVHVRVAAACNDNPVAAGGGAAWCQRRAGA